MGLTIVEWLLSATLAFAAVKMKLDHVGEGVDLAVKSRARARRWAHWGIKVVLGFVALALFIDPLISGTAVVMVHAPQGTPAMEMENLSVRAIPIGFRGAADPTHYAFGNFDERGVAVLEVEFRILENRMNVELFNATGDDAVARKPAHVSPFVRVGLWTMNVKF